MITCAITTSVLGCLATTFLFVRHFWFLEFPLWLKISLAFVFVLAGCIPLLVEYHFEKALGSLYPFYRYGLYFVYVGCIIWFTLTIAGDLGAFAALRAGLIKAMPGRTYSLALTAAAFLCAAYALHAGTKVPDVKIVDLYSGKAAEETKIVLLSDIHIHRVISPAKVKGIVEKTNALEPDIILLNGDIIDDDVRRVHEVSLLLKGLKAKKGIYFVTGNHEFYAGYQPTVDELKSFGFTFLENGGVSAGEIYLAGIPDIFAGQAYGHSADIAKAFAGAGAEQFKILLSHTPADFKEKNDFDLELSGHTHGGQIFPFHILTKLHNRYLAGMYDMENGAKIYVTRGSGQWGPQMRFLAPSEITLLTIKPESI